MSKGKSRKACTSRRTKKRADVEALKKAEEEIKALSRFPAENPDVVMRISRDGDILYCNRAGLPILNEWKCEVGQPVPSGWLQLVADIYRSGIKKEIEEKHGTQTLLMMLVPIVGEGYVNVYGLDITERKKTEERLKRLNSVLSAIRNVNQLIAREKDLDKLLKETCDHLTENLGYYNAFVCLFDEAKKFVSGFESGLGENFPPLVQLFKSGRLTRCAFEAMAQAGVVLIESPSKDCSDCPIAEVYEGKSALSARLGYEDSVYGFITAAAPSSAIHEEVEQRLFEEVAGDIAFALHNIELENARKKAEEALRKAHDELEMRVEERTKELRTASLYARSLIEVSLDPLVTINPQGKINDVNKSTEEVTGFSREQLIGSDFSEYFTDPEEARKSYRRVFADGFVRDYPLAIRHKSGKITEVLYNATVYQNEAGEIQGVFAAARDITERKKAEEALQKAYDELDMRVQERTKDLRQATEELKAEIIEHQKAEDALLESQKDLNRAQAVAKTGSWRLDVRRNELLWSDETYRMFGIPKGTPLTYETFLSTVLPDDRKYVDQKWQAAMRGEPYDIEHRIVVNGEVKWVREKAELELNKDGVLLGGFGTVQDVTERKRIEDELRETSDYLDSLLNYANAPIIVWDPEFKITKFNHAFERLTGHKAEEVLGTNLSTLFPEQSREASLTEIQHTLAGEYWEVVEIPILRKDGNVRTVLWNSANIYATDGKTLRATMAQGQDITERKQLEEKLIHSERKYRTLYETTVDGIVSFDMDGHIIECNDAYARMLGYSKDELKGMTYQQLTPEKWHKMEDNIIKEQIIKRGHSDLYEKEHIKRDGSIFPISIRVWLTRDEKWKPVAMWGIIRDITLTKHMQNELKRYAEHLESLVEERTEKLKDAERLATIGETAAMVGHDIRNPLQTIEGAIYLAKEETKSLPTRTQEIDNIEEMLNTIQEETEYVDKIVSDLQDYARPLTPELEETDVQKLINSVLTENPVPPNIGVSVTVEQDCCTVVVDPTMMKRILANLITNAVQAMPNGGKLTIQASKKEEQVSISVRDTGMGISRENKPKMFQPLFSTKAKGQGFGLAVVKRLVEAHNGTITFESEAGKGTTFTVAIPLAKEVT